MTHEEGTREAARLRLHPGLDVASRSPRPRPSGRSSRSTPGASAAAVDHYYVDPATSGKKSLFDRTAGKELATTLRKGDHVMVARLDRLSRSFVGFARILEFWQKLGMTLHLCDMPGGGVFDPDNPMTELMIGILIVFAKYERKLISVRTKEGLQAIRDRGEKYCRWAEYGWRWEKRHDPRSGKLVNVKVPDEREREILRKAVELRAAGHSLDQIRQHLNYGMKARTRTGGEWTTSRIAFLVQQGLRLMAETEGGDPEEFLDLGGRGGGVAARLGMAADTVGEFTAGASGTANSPARGAPACPSYGQTTPGENSPTVSASAEWKAEYAVARGWRGRCRRGVRGFGLRRCRYIGLAKARLQHVATAAAINVYRLSDWLGVSRVRRRERHHSCDWWPDRNSPTVSADEQKTGSPVARMGMLLYCLIGEPWFDC